MMIPKIITSNEITLVGMNFFGDPFSKASGWDTDNEIGTLWNRLKSFLNENPETIKNRINKNVFIETHIINENTFQTGEYEIFCGVIVDKLQDIPLECVIKILPATEYAVFTMKGKQIVEMDWYKRVFDEWLPKAGYESSYDFSFQHYDERFKSLDDLDTSELDFYFPVKKIG